jgi:ornithine cyclodeaminase/alanine dehydrogenase-like protein (mu-crystallin family)
MFGAGWQARMHASAMCAIRKIERIDVYSPTRENREAYASELQQSLGVSVRPAESPDEAAQDADILVAATNSVSVVIPPEWARPGRHVTCVKSTELDDETIRRCDRIVVHTHKHAPDNYVAGFGDERIEMHDPIDLVQKRQAAGRHAAESPFWLQSPELKDLVAGRFPGRGSEREVTCFMNNIGLGVQFAALGSAAFQAAKARGMGREIPTEWFLQDLHP